MKLSVHDSAMKFMGPILESTPCTTSKCPKEWLWRWCTKGRGSSCYRGGCWNFAKQIPLNEAVQCFLYCRIIEQWGWACPCGTTLGIESPAASYRCDWSRDWSYGSRNSCRNGPNNWSTCTWCVVQNIKNAMLKVNLLLIGWVWNNNETWQLLLSKTFCPTNRSNLQL
jgi:hypothetical protein